VGDANLYTLGIQASETFLADSTGAATAVRPAFLAVASRQAGDTRQVLWVAVSLERGGCAVFRGPFGAGLLQALHHGDELEVLVPSGVGLVCTQLQAFVAGQDAGQCASHHLLAGRGYPADSLLAQFFVFTHPADAAAAITAALFAVAVRDADFLALSGLAGQAGGTQAASSATAVVAARFAGALGCADTLAVVAAQTLRTDPAQSAATIQSAHLAGTVRDAHTGEVHAFGTQGAMVVFEALHTGQFVRVAEQFVLAVVIHLAFRRLHIRHLSSVSVGGVVGPFILLGVREGFFSVFRPIRQDPVTIGIPGVFPHLVPGEAIFDGQFPGNHLRRLQVFGLDVKGQRVRRPPVRSGREAVPGHQISRFAPPVFLALVPTCQEVPHIREEETPGWLRVGTTGQQQDARTQRAQEWSVFHGLPPPSGS